MRFSIRDLLWLTLLMAVLITWLISNAVLRRNLLLLQIEQTNLEHREAGWRFNYQRLLDEREALGIK